MKTRLLQGLWGLLYVPGIILLAYFEYHLSSTIMFWSLVAVVAYIVCLIIVLGMDHVFPGVFLSILFTGIIGDALLLRIHGELLGYSWTVYIVAALMTGIVMALSASELLEPGRHKPVLVRAGIGLASFASILLSIYLFRIIAPNMLSISMAPLFIIGLSIVLYSLYIFYDQSLFQLLVKHMGGTRKRPDTDKYLYTQILSFFIFTLAIVVVLIPNFKPSERPYLAISILYSYLYGGLSLSLIAALFLGHSTIAYTVLGRKRVNDYLLSSIKEYLRLRYISSIINLFKYVEASPWGRKTMNVPVKEALEEGYKSLPRYTGLMRIYRRTHDLLRYLDEIKVLEAKPDMINMLREIDPSGYLAKTFEAIVLKAYKMKITGDQRYTKELKQLKSVLRSYKSKTMGEDREKIIDLLEKMRDPNILDELVYVTTPRLRHLRNRLVHGRLSRELILRGDKPLDDFEFLDDPISMYITCSCLITYITNIGDKR
ncbi:MAG: hypothetical protein GXO43_03805 [Crenarchaeota archaeon]|nr:hypothetical protein [Thermoproteota archaeon]